MESRPTGYHPMGVEREESLLWPMLEALLSFIANHSIVVIVANKAQKCKHEQYKRMDQFQIGKRRITLLQPA
jgi:hypothetical protein